MGIHTLPAVKNRLGQMEPLRVGEWYAAHYGFSVVTGYCTDVLHNGAILKFRWGGPMRERNFIHSREIIGECNDPRFFAKILRLVRAR